MNEMEQKRESIIRCWFSMWLQGKDLGIEKIFSPDCTYIESWGPKYENRDKVVLWFREWNNRGRVVRWDIEQFFHKDGQTIVEWSFCDEMKDGRREAFHGLSLVRWDAQNRICFVQEFGCNLHNYDPYAQGEVPVFPEEPVAWF